VQLLGGSRDVAELDDAGEVLELAKSDDSLEAARAARAS
jgi:hypothetical protein